MTPIFCQKGNEKSGLTPPQKKTSIVDRRWCWQLSLVDHNCKEPQIIMATCLIINVLPGETCHSSFCPSTNLQRISGSLRSQVSNSRTMSRKSKKVFLCRTKKAASCRKIVECWNANCHREIELLALLVYGGRNSPAGLMYLYVSEIYWHPALSVKTER